MRHSAVLLALTIAIAAAPVDAKLYKWIDANGNVHYSDHVPPEAATREREVKTEDGHTVQRLAAPKTREELETERREQEAERERQRLREQQAEQDRLLLLAYTSVQQMERARDERLATLDSRIKLTEARTTSLREQIESLRQRAVQQERTGKGSPQETYAQITSLESQIALNEESVRAALTEQAAIRKKFAADIERFQRLSEQAADKLPTQP